MKQSFIVLAVIIAACACLWLFWGAGWRDSATDQPIRLGVLHAQTGIMSTSEAPLIDTIVMAVDEINQGGGVLGRPLELMIADTQSDPSRAAHQAERLIIEGADVLFGCWTSSCRRAVLPILERHNQLLFYPLQYEGLETSPHIVYTGLVPNQQGAMSIAWMVRRFGSDMMLVGSDYEFPRLLNLQLHESLAFLGGRILGESYIGLDATEEAVDELVEKTVEVAPDFIVNTINGPANALFFRRLKARLTELALPIPGILSFSIGETEVAIDGDAFAGSYVSWGYLESIDSPENHRFINHFRQLFGSDRVISDPMQSSYVAVKLWARAVEVAGSARPEDVYVAIDGQSMIAPEGVVAVSIGTHHLWRKVRLGRVEGDGRITIVEETPTPVQPQPFMMARSERQWHSLKASVLAP